MFFEDKKDDIPTALRKKLPVASVDGKKVTLKNGAEIHLDKDFVARGDRKNLAVYIISKELVPTDTPMAEMKHNKEGNKKIQGGADYGSKKEDLFHNVLTDCCKPENKDRDPALEVLVSLLAWSKKTYPELHKTVCSQLSNDTLASLAIILQPYRSTLDECTYITPVMFGEWCGVGSNKAIPSSYGYHPAPVQCYKDCMNEPQKGVSDIQDAREELCEGVAKITIVKKITAFYSSIKNKLEGQRAIVAANAKLAFAESELRVFSAIMHDNSQGCLNYDEAKTLYCRKCTLNEPYVCADSKNIAASNLGFYYSTAYLIARSDALLYLPGVGGDGSLDDIANENLTIDLNRNCTLDSSMDSSYSSIFANNSAMAEMYKKLGYSS